MKVSVNRRLGRRRERAVVLRGGLAVSVRGTVRAHRHRRRSHRFDRFSELLFRENLKFSLFFIADSKISS